MSCLDVLQAARALRPGLSWCLDDESNASGDDGELTITVYALSDEYMVIAQVGIFVIGIARTAALPEALDELDQQIAQEAADPGSTLNALRAIKRMLP